MTNCNCWWGGSVAQELKFDCHASDKFDIMVSYIDQDQQSQVMVDIIKNWGCSHVFGEMKITFHSLKLCFKWKVFRLVQKATITGWLLNGNSKIKLD